MNLSDIARLAWLPEETRKALGIKDPEVIPVPAAGFCARYVPDYDQLWLEDGEHVQINGTGEIEFRGSRIILHGKQIDRLEEILEARR